MRLWILPILLLLSTGCRTHLVLQDRTLETAGTIADLNFQQVLDNVARYSSHPATLPSIAVINNGSVVVSDQDNIGGAATYSPTVAAFQQAGGFPILSFFLSPSVSRNLTENWSMVPVTDINKIRRLRCAFQLLVCGQQCNECENCLKTLDGFFPTDAEHLSCAIPQGWYCVGCEADVPDDACFVGSYHDTFVWVMPQNVEGLSRFTMTIMQLASSELDPPGKKTILKKYNAENELEGTEVTTEETDEDSKKERKVKQSGNQTNVTIPNRRLVKSHTLSPKNTALTPKQARKRIGISS